MTQEQYESRVQELEAEGITRSDAQGVADVEQWKAKALADLIHYSENVLEDLCDQDTGCYYQFSAAVKAANILKP